MRPSIPEGKEAMYAGLVGRYVDAYNRYTEAHPTQVAVQLLIAIGNAVGRQPHLYVGETRHGLQNNALIVGRTAEARKGDGGNIAIHALAQADELWAANIRDGLSSGEGLIYHVRDEIKKVDKKNGDETVVDPGVPDKRLLVVETEFANVLKNFERQGNTLSVVIRNAWDGKPVLRSMTKNSPTRATGAHISILGHTTPEDLHAYLSSVDAANGLGNRFLFVETDRARHLPLPERVPDAIREQLVGEVTGVLSAAKRVGEMHFSPDAAEVWKRLYPKLTRSRPGLIGGLLARNAAHVRRLSALYALLDGDSLVQVSNLNSALAVWDVCVASVERIFAGRTGNTDADRIDESMIPGTEMTFTEIREQVFSRKITSGRLKSALALLTEMGRYVVFPQETGGRPAQVVRRLTERERAELEGQREKAEKGEKSSYRAHREGFSPFSSFSDQPGEPVP